MVTELRSEGGGTQLVSANLKKTILAIKEVVKNHSDSDIYNALKDCNMDPNETTQKLLHQDPFHLVRRRRDKKKENADDGNVDPRKPTDHIDQVVNFHGSDRNVRRGGHSRNSAHDGGGRQFRVVRDNRVNQNSDRGLKSSSQFSLGNVRRINNFSERRSYGVSNNQRHWGGRYIQQNYGRTDFRPRFVREMNSNSKKGHWEEKKTATTGSDLQVSEAKQNDSQSQLGSPVSSSAVGVYASASDPVHVPSPDSRAPAAIGATRRDIGVVGGRRQSSESGVKQSYQQNNSNLNSVLGSSSTVESFCHINSTSRHDQNHAGAVESAMISSTSNRLTNHFNNRLHQQPVSQKGVFPTKEWKPKTNQKSSASSPGVIGSPVKSASHQADGLKNAVREADELCDKFSQVNIHESQNVIIAQHIRVPENDRCRVTFGSFGADSDSAENSASAFQATDVVEEETMEASTSNNLINAADDQVQNSASSSPSGKSAENQLPETKDSAGVSSSENYADMGLVPNNSSFTTSNSQQHQDSSQVPNISAYDSQPTYDIPYFRPSIDDAVRGPGLPSPHEALSSHTANSVPTSSVAMMQQQTPMPQMYPQVHLSHFPNVMPYRQFIPPMYVPPMVPGYSGNPGYPHLSNGSSYVLMPGGGSHLPANSLKYGVQQFKPFPAGSPTGFGSVVNPTGYAMNAPGVVGGPTGLDDSSRLKYKDNNIYVPNPQAETSEMWIQNHREISGMQSTPYFSMQGQTAHPAYMQSHTGHTSFNAAAVAQSSQMQFPGMYPPQPTGIPNAHHMGAGNLGVGVAAAAPGAQVGAYQQPQMSHHLNWTTNF